MILVGFNLSSLGLTSEATQEWVHSHRGSHGPIPNHPRIVATLWKGFSFQSSGNMIWWGICHYAPIRVRPGLGDCIRSPNAARLHRESGPIQMVPSSEASGPAGLSEGAGGRGSRGSAAQLFGGLGCNVESESTRGPGQDCAHVPSCGLSVPKTSAPSAPQEELRVLKRGETCGETRLRKTKNEDVRTWVRATIKVYHVAVKCHYSSRLLEAAVCCPMACLRPPIYRAM